MLEAGGSIIALLLFLAGDGGNGLAHKIALSVDNDEDGRSSERADETKMDQGVLLQCLAIGGTRNCRQMI